MSSQRSASVFPIDSDRVEPGVEVQDGAPMFWTHSPEMRKVAWIIEQVADSNVTVLIRGESGVGKELVARAIHQRSPRKDRPYIKVNCAALPAELLENEMFGHEKGAFTGAVTTRVGKFEQADSGTIFLDEIGELSSALQAKLLHVVQDAQFTRLGSSRPVSVDVRVIAATNRDLEEMMLQGAFREDLFYRLKVIEITVPALRDRRGEIRPLCRFFMNRYALQYNRPDRELSSDLLQRFEQYDWPGNIRELENMIKRIVILQDEQIVVQELTRGAAPAQPEPAPPVEAPTWDEIMKKPLVSDAAPGPVMAPASSNRNGSRLADVAKAAALSAERSLIEATLNRTRWNRKRAAEQLDVSYKTLLNRIKECGISRTDA